MGDITLHICITSKLIKTDPSWDYFNTFCWLGAYYANNCFKQLLEAKAEVVKLLLADWLINVRVYNLVSRIISDYTEQLVKYNIIVKNYTMLGQMKLLVCMK